MITKNFLKIKTFLRLVLQHQPNCSMSQEEKVYFTLYNILGEFDKTGELEDQFRSCWFKEYEDEDGEVFIEDTLDGVGCNQFSWSQKVYDGLEKFYASYDIKYDNNENRVYTNIGKEYIQAAFAMIIEDQHNNFDGLLTWLKDEEYMTTNFHGFEREYIVMDYIGKYENLDHLQLTDSQRSFMEMLSTKVVLEKIMA